MKERGKLVISLDFEMQYGMEDIPFLEFYKKNITGGREVLSFILTLFEK